MAAFIAPHSSLREISPCKKHFSFKILSNPTTDKQRIQTKKNALADPLQYLKI